MIKRNQKYLNAINFISDIVICYISFYIALYVRFIVLAKNQHLYNLGLNKDVALTYSLLSGIVYLLKDVYAPQRKISRENYSLSAFVHNIFSLFLLIVIRYIRKENIYSRLTLVFLYLFSSVLISFKRLFIKKILEYFRSNKRNLKHVVVVGNGHLAKEFVNNVNENLELGFCVDGYISKYAKDGLGKQLGSYEETEKIISNKDIDEIVIALEPHEINFLPLIIDASEKEGIKISIIPFYNDYMPAEPRIEEIGTSKMFSIRSIPLDRLFNAFVKRSLDIIISLFLLILLSPLLILVALGVKIFNGKGKIIFKQERIGKNRKTFNMYKFRSMRVNDEENTAWSTNKDNRKTIFGSIIRKLSIDELPQLINVLKGDMSLIGPRPEIPHFVDKFKDEIPLYMLRHAVRPGISGWAQVNGYRGDTSIVKRIEYDIWYIEHWTLALDIKIFFMTMSKLINKEKVGKQ